MGVRSCFSLKPETWKLVTHLVAGVRPALGIRRTIVCQEEMEQDPEVREPEPAGEWAEAPAARVAVDAAGAVDLVPGPGEIVCVRAVARRRLTSWAPPVMNRNVPSAVLR